jgi:hypothetical protein
MAAVTSTFATVDAQSRSLALDLAPIPGEDIRPGFSDAQFRNALHVDEVEALRTKGATAFPARCGGTIADVGHAAPSRWPTPASPEPSSRSQVELLADWRF